MMSPNTFTGQRRLRRYPCSLLYLTEIIKLRIDNNKFGIEIPADLEIIDIIKPEAYDKYGFCEDVVYLVCKSREFDIVPEGEEIPELPAWQIVLKEKL